MDEKQCQYALFAWLTHLGLVHDGRVVAVSARRRDGCGISAGLVRGFEL